MESKSGASIMMPVVPEKVQAAVLPQPAAETDTEAVRIVSETYAQLDSQRPTPAEQGEKLYVLARKTARRDAIDSDLYKSSTANLSVIPAVAGLGGGMGGLIAEVANFAPSGHEGEFASAALIGLTLFVRSAFAQSQQSKLRTLHSEEAYNLQCLRVQEHGREQHSTVAVAIHPNVYTEDQPEASAQGKQLLAEALETVDAAVKQDTKGVIGSIIIPRAAAETAGLPTDNAKPYGKVIREIKTDLVGYPYTNAIEAIVVPAHLAGKMAELARQDKDALLHQVFRELSERFPSKREALQEGNAAVIEVLHGMLERATADASGIRTKQKDITRTVAYKTNEDGTRTATQIEGWNGGIRTSTEDVSTYINRKNKFNPTIQQRTSGSLQEVANADLRTMTGGLETMMDIAGKLKGGSYSKLQLIRVALELLEKRGVEKEKAEAAAEQWAKGSARSDITAIQKLKSGELQPRRWAMRRKFIGRAAVGVTAAYAVISGALSLIPSSEGAQPPQAPTTSGDLESVTSYANQQLWRIDEHGMRVQSPYWGQQAEYQVTDKSELRRSRNKWQSLVLPAVLPDQHEPHLMVSTLTSSDYAYLPVEDGTRVSAIRATAGATVFPVNIQERSDGIIAAQVKNDAPDGKYTHYRLEYDLTKSNAPTFVPMYPLSISVPTSGETINAADYPGSDGDVPQYIRDHFIYDANPQIANVLKDSTPKEYLDKMYQMSRCKCDQCNQTAAMLEHLQDPAKKMALVDGYLHNGLNTKDGHSYLGSGPMHEWLNDGEINDATSGRFDTQSVLPDPEQRIDQVDAAWNKTQQDWHLAPPAEKNHSNRRWVLMGGMALGALMYAGALTGYKRDVQEMYEGFTRWDAWRNAAADIDPRDAVRFMHWATYGGPASPLPDMKGEATYRGEQAETLPTGRLVDFANGKFDYTARLNDTQRRGIQQTARAILKERDRTPQRRAVSRHRK